MLPLVAGIVSNLINNGMHKVADQVIEKGVDAVQDKLGIELKPEGEATPEYNAKLQAEANRHAEFMAELRMAYEVRSEGGSSQFSVRFGRGFR